MGGKGRRKGARWRVIRPHRFQRLGGGLGGGRQCRQLAGRISSGEMAMRFGINVTMYALTGNYKADQVHVPYILERLER